MAVAFIRPAPPRLSEAQHELRAIEDRGVFSNFGPVNSRFEQDMVATVFGGIGAAMTTCNATIGLMLAIKQATGHHTTRRRYALMPSFTFAATAHAAMWCGLTPLFCDIDPVTWTPSAASEERLIAEYGADIAVVVPYATFGYDMDLNRYEALQDRRGIPVVVDAAASLGTVSAKGLGFGSGSNTTIVFSMHATKPFASGEAGIVYSADSDRIAALRKMCNFGFGQPRVATMPGLNGKLSEVGALLCQLRLSVHEDALDHRATVMSWYRKQLPQLTFQPFQEGRQAHQFIPALLPEDLAPYRSELAALLTAEGIGNGAYFSPHLSQQEYFMAHAAFERLPVTDDVAGRIISLPISDAMTQAEVREVTTVFNRQIARFSERADHDREPMAVEGVLSLP